MAVEVCATWVKTRGKRQFDSISAMFSFMAYFSASRTCEALSCLAAAKLFIEERLREILGELSPFWFF